MFQLLERLLLQDNDPDLRHPSGHVLGLRVRLHHLLARVVRDPMHEGLHDQLRMSAEVLRHLSGVLPPALV